MSQAELESALLGCCGKGKTGYKNIDSIFIQETDYDCKNRTKVLNNIMGMREGRALGTLDAEKIYAIVKDIFVSGVWRVIQTEQPAQEPT